MTAPVQTATKSTTGNLQIYGPPVGLVPLTDDAWRRWFTEVVWPIIGAGINNSGPQVTTPQLQVGQAQFTTVNAFQALLNVNQGLYVTYSSGINNIIYGFACNVHRSSGTAFVVGAQINAWGEAGSSGGVFGIACTALAQPFSGSRGMTGIEPDIANLSSTNTGVKWGINPVFKDRGDGAATVTEGLGSNLYNYNATGIAFTSQTRSGTGEFCGWSVGMDFLDGALDQSSVVAWSATTTYDPGAVVSSGGVLWKAIVSSLNQLPAGGSAFWVQRTYAGTVNLAIGIDFSSMSIASMARMASAIRFRNTMLLHWEETGAVGTRMDNATSILRLCENQGALRFGVDVGTGVVNTSQSPTALGGGAAATLGTIGGSGPTTAAQNKWEKVVLNGTTYWRPLWI